MLNTALDLRVYERQTISSFKALLSAFVLGITLMMWCSDGTFLLFYPLLTFFVPYAVIAINDLRSAQQQEELRFNYPLRNVIPKLSEKELLDHAKAALEEYNAQVIQWQVRLESARKGTIGRVTKNN